MKVAIDSSPLENSEKSGHKVRGVGNYLRNLRLSLLRKYPEDDFVFYHDKKIPLNAEVVHFPYFEPFFLNTPSVKNFSAVVTVHDLTPLVFPSNFPVGLKGQLKWRIQRHRLRHFKRIITDSKCSKNDIVRLTGIPKEKIEVIYLAAGENFKKIKEKKLLEEIKKKYSLPDEFALYVGDATWNKNVVRLAHAIKKANIPLVICGKAISDQSVDPLNPWNQELITFQNIIKNDKLFYPLGFVSDEELPVIYSLATAMIMPSLYEGFGLPVLEAMQCGLPVITSREGSLPEVAGNAAYFVDAYDDNSIAEGLREVFGSAQLKEKLTGLGYKQAESFSWEKTAKLTYEVYLLASQG